MILIIGAITDPHVQSVVRHLDISDADYSILDRFNYDENTGAIISEIGSGALLHLGQGIEAKRVTAIWWRQKPPSIIPAGNVSDYYDSVFSSQEWTHVFRYLEYNFRDTFSINTPEKSIIANNKLFQLELARRIGFLIPETLISNNYEAVKEFAFNANSSKIIFKTLNAYMNPIGLLTYTTIIDKDLIKRNKASIATAPGIYQKYIEKKAELRITVVGNQIFTAKVKPVDDDENYIDWREHTFKDIFEIFEPEESFKSMLLQFHKSLGLFYGAYDFIINKENEYIFLEVNPTGQWLWLETKLGFPISSLIADSLRRGDRDWNNPTILAGIHSL